MIFLLILGLISGPRVSKPYHTLYIEKKDGSVRKLSARVHENEIFLDNIQGSFPNDLKTSPPWYLVGLPAFEETISLEIEGLSVLPLKREFHQVEEKKILGEHLIRYQTHLLLKAKEEIIPLNDQETKINEVLKPLGIQEIKLEGEGDIWFDPEKKSIITEQFVLSGAVLRNNRKEKWQIEYARGLEQ